MLLAVDIGVHKLVFAALERRVEQRRCGRVVLVLPLESREIVVALAFGVDCGDFAAFVE